jgi:AcrR family transcriptional regulator
MHRMVSGGATMVTEAAVSARRRARNAREEILDAAQRVVARDGAGRLTLDAVAAEVGMTKGGVLYNFGSKAALLRGMLERMIATFEAVLDAAAEKNAGLPNPTLRALLTVADHLERIDPELQAAILAAAAENPGALDPLRRLVTAKQERILAEAGDPVMALVLLAAFDGMKLQRMMRLPPTAPATRAAMLERLRALAGALEGRS